MFQRIKIVRTGLQTRSVFRLPSRTALETRSPNFFAISGTLCHAPMAHPVTHEKVLPTAILELKMKLLYSLARKPYAGFSMLLVAAALEEELKTGMVLCQGIKKIDCGKVSLWEGARGERSIRFLKTGVGPKRCAKSLAEALTRIKPSHIHVIGYAGALDPELKLGDLVAVRKAIAIRLDKDCPQWEYARVGDTFELADGEALVESATAVGLKSCVGDVLTSSRVLGSPAHKQLLREKFRASIVDMETAALACIAASKSIPLSCIRAVSDEVQDTFLEPFSYDPSVPITARARKLLDTGMIQTVREWKSNSSVARERLSLFLSHYL
jgi:nucleoside phosphorylase